jgi:hypothetical protein
LGLSVVRRPSSPPKGRPPLSIVSAWSSGALRSVPAAAVAVAASKPNVASEASNLLIVEENLSRWCKGGVTVLFAFAAAG